VAFDFNIIARVQAQYDQASFDRVASTAQQRLQGVKVTVGADTASATSNLAKLTGGAAASQAALRALQTQATATGASLSATVSVGGKAADTIANLAQQAGLAARRFVAMAAAAGSIALIVRGFRDGIAAAVDFDLAMNKVQQASGDTSDKIAQIRTTITGLSTTLGVSSKELADVALKFKSAGLSVKETQDALKAVALTDLSSQFGSIAETGEAVIAVMRQFHIESDKLAATFGGVNAVAKAFAIESRDIVEGVKKAGGAFANVGGDINEFIGLMTAVRGTTRESAEEISTGLRTIFTRLQRADTVKALEDLSIHLRYTREEAVALGNTKLENQFVGAYEAVKRLSEGLEGLKTTDPRYAAVVEQLGGYRQISRVIPLLKQFEDAERAKNVALAGGISLTADAEARQVSLANKLDVLKEKFLATFRAIAETKGFQAMADAFLKLATGLSQVLDFAKPLVPVLAALAAIRIGSSLGSIVQNARSAFVAPVGASLAPPIRRAGGGTVPGSGDGDTVPALLTPGEFVIRKQAAQQIGYGRLQAMNEGRQRFAGGGMVRHYATGTGPNGVEPQKLTPDQNKLIEEAFAKGLVEKAIAAELRKNPTLARNVSTEDVGQDALLAAAQGFDPGKGGKFSTYFRTVLRNHLYGESNKPHALSGESVDGGPSLLDVASHRTGEDPLESDRRRQQDLERQRLEFQSLTGADAAVRANKAGDLNANDVRDRLKAVGITPAHNATGDELTKQLIDRVRTDHVVALGRQNGAFGDGNGPVGPPKPPGYAYPNPDFKLNRGNGTFAVPLSRLDEVVNNTFVRSQFEANVRRVAAESNKLADVMEESTHVVVRLNNGLAKFVGLKDVGGRSAAALLDVGGLTGRRADGTVGPLGTAQLSPTGPLASFGGFGSVPPPARPVAFDAAREREQARLEAAARSRALATGRVLPLDAVSHQEEVLAQDRARRELDAQRRAALYEPPARVRRVLSANVGVSESQRLRDVFQAQEYFEADARPTLRRRVGGALGATRRALFTQGEFVQRLDGRFAGVGGNVALGANLAVPIAAEGIDYLGGKPGVASDSRYAAAHGASGFLQGAVLGATVGGTLGSVTGPGAVIGAAAGAVAGGLYGLVKSLDEAAADIAKVKINNALTAFADRLQSVNNAIAGGGLSSVSPSALADLSAQYRTQRAAQTEANRREATHTFGGFDPDEFNTLQQKSDRQNLSTQLPGVQQFLNAQVADLVRRNPGAKPADLVGRVLADNGGANGEFAAAAANVRQLSPADFRKELEKYALSQQKAKSVEDAGRAAKDDQTLAANAFGRLLLAVESASDSLSGLQAKAQALGEAFDGSVTAIHVTGAEQAGQFGRQDRAGVTAFDTVAAVGGEPGRALRRGAVAIDDVKRVLQGVLTNVAGRDRLGDEDAATAVNSGVLGALKIDPKNVPPEIQRALNTVKSGILEQTHGTSEKPFNDAIKLDVTKEADRLLAPLEEPFKQIGGKIALEIQENANKFIDGLATLTKRLQQAGEAQDRVSELALGRVRTEAQIQGFREGRPGQALDSLTLAQLSEPARARAARLAQEGGLGAGQSEDVVAIGRQLADVSKRIPEAIDKQQDVFKRTGGQGPEFQAATNALALLQRQASSLTAALHNLADVSTRAAAAQAKVEQFQRERDSRLSLGERFLTASPEQQQELNRGALLANAANKQGNFNGFIGEDVASAAGFLRSAGTATLSGFTGAPRADDLLKKLVGNTAGGAFGLNGTQAKEESEAQKELVRLSKASEDAQKAYAESLKRSSESYFENLKSQQQQFFGRLVAEIKGVSLADAVNKAGRTSVEAKEALATTGSAGRLNDLGLTSPAQVKANADALNSFVEASSAILERQKQAAGVAGTVLAKAPPAIFTDAGRNNYLTQEFPGLDEAARNRVADSVRRKRNEYYDQTGDNPNFEVAKQHLAQSVRAELLNEQEGPYRAAEDRQYKALDQLRSVKGINVNGLVDIARDDTKKVQFQNDIAAVRDLATPFSVLKDKSDNLAAELGRLQQSAQQLHQAVEAARTPPTEQGPAPRVAGGFFAAGGSIFQPRGTDTVPAMLTPGEFVVRRQAAEANRGLLERINGANGPLYKAEGGMVGVFKRFVRGTVETMKDATGTVANAVGSGEEGKRREELERKLAEAKTKPQYRASGGDILDWRLGSFTRPSADEVLAGIDTRARPLKPPSAGEVRANTRPLFSAEEEERRRRAFADPNSVIGAVPSLLTGPRPVDDRLEQPDVPGRGGLLRPVPFEEQLRRAKHETERLRRLTYLSDSANQPGLAKGRYGVYTPVTPGPYDPASIRDELSGRLPTVPNYGRDDVVYPADTAKAGDPVIRGNTTRAQDASEERARQFAEARARYLAQPAKLKTAAAGVPVASDVGSDLDREAAINPYGASALFRAHQQGGGRGSALLFAGQVADFNRRSYFANFSHDPIAERLTAARQQYNLEAGRQERRRARPMLFAGGGPVPGTGVGDTVPAMLTPGEFVLRQSAVQRAGSANLQHFNNGGPVYRADGGPIPAGGGGDFAQAAGGLSTALNQWSQEANSFGQQLAQAFTTFAGPAHALTEAMQAFPKTLSMTAQHNVVVTFNGAEVLARLTPELRDMAVEAAKAEIRKSFKEALPDAGAHLS
jgi:TP901 family phage tail tape measure protein